MYLNCFRVIEPTILLDPPLDAEIMEEEIFGPLLPIITVRTTMLMLIITKKKSFKAIAS